MDLQILVKQEGTVWSCLHDEFINAGHMSQKNISDGLYKECPPKKYTNTTLGNILKM